MLTIWSNFALQRRSHESQHQCNRQEKICDLVLQTFKELIVCPQTKINNKKTERLQVCVILCTLGQFMASAIQVIGNSFSVVAF